MIRTLVAIALLSSPAVALQLPDGATLAAADESPRDTLSFPVGPWEAAGTPVQRVDGAIRREVWHLPGTRRTTGELLSPLRESLRNDGYNILYSCDDEDCGGFDFRYQLDLLAEPEMHVDLGDYRYLAARKSGGTDVIILVISRSASTGFIHIAHAGTPRPIPSAGPATATASAPEGAPIGEQLETTGHAILEDLIFATGSATLESRAFPSLSNLADWLRDDATRRVVLVGHSDAVGELAGNITLSRDRARAVVARLADAHGIDPERLSAEGIGYLSPRATNATDKGRAANRRVEVVVASP